MLCWTFNIPAIACLNFWNDHNNFNKSYEKGSEVHAQDEMSGIAFKWLKNMLVQTSIILASDWNKDIREYTILSKYDVGGTSTKLDETE